MDPRKSTIKNRIAVSISPNHWTRISFPEKSLKGVEPMSTEGFIIDTSETLKWFPNHILIRSSNLEYSSKVLVFGASGIDYLLDVKAEECGDSKLSLTKKKMRSAEKTSNVGDRQVKFLASHMAFIDTIPPGYRKITYNEPYEERIVMSQGSVQYYIAEQYIGPKFVGSVFEVVNKGRASYKLDITAFDFDSAKIIEAFGDVHHTAMLPINRVLKPKPSKSKMNHKNERQNFGLVYVVSERKHGR